MVVKELDVLYFHTEESFSLDTTVACYVLFLPMDKVALANNAPIDKKGKAYSMKVAKGLINCAFFFTAVGLSAKPSLSA